MTIKVIATDMDGTFLDDKGSYDKERFSQILMPWLRVICTLSLHQVIV
ncbi:MAG: hypothetical protein ACLS9T_09615 [Streptococcus salivarius]